MSVETIERAKSRKPTETTQPPHTSLWEAFAAAQAEFGPIIKSATGAHKATYAPLDVVLEAMRPILNKHGLALTQATFVAEATLFVRSSAVHVSTGEMHSAEYPAGVLTLQHQQLGAGVTYARRYSLLSLLGVFPENEDDDGEKAGAAGGPPPNPPARQQPISKTQLADLQKLVDDTGSDIEAFCRYLKVGALADLTAPDAFNRAKSALETKKRQQQAAP